MNLEEEQLEFINPETAAKYEACVSEDQWVWILGRRSEGTKCYRGFLSEVDPEQAARLVNQGSNLLQEKQ